MPSPSWSPADPAAAFTEPLAFAYDLHRPALDLTAAQARAIGGGKATTWPELGQPGGAVRLHQDAAQISAAETEPPALVVVPAAAVRPTVQVARVAGVDPLRNPRRYPVTTPATWPEPRVSRRSP